MDSQLKQFVELGLWWIAGFAYLSLVLGFASWWQPVALWAIFVLLFFVTRYQKGPTMGLLLVAFLGSLSLLMLYRLDPQWGATQWQGWLYGSIAYLVALQINWEEARYKYVYGVGALILLLVTGAFGVEVGGAKAWLDIGIVRFQPIEFARILIVLFLAGFFHDNRQLLRFEHGWWIWRYWAPLGLLLSIVFLLLALQRDLGPALLFFVLYVTLSLYALFNWRLLVIYLVSLVFGSIIAWWQFAHFRQRILAWLNPWEYADTLGYQIIQGLFALQAGGFFGVGLGQGLGQSIPAVHTDYLFALIGEEWGLLGLTLTVTMYVALFFWGLQISRYLPERSQLLAIGIVLLWAFQLFLVIGGILRLLPLTGMTLPFMSYGTSSLLTNMWLLGMMTRLGRGQSID